MNAILVDDLSSGLTELKYYLEKDNDINVLGMYKNPFEGLEQIKEQKPDIVFLDVEMPEMDGITLAKNALESIKTLKIIFVTAYNKYATEAFKIAAIHYILKPFNKDDLNEALNRARESLNTNLLKTLNSNEFLQKIVLWKDDKAVVCNTSDIIQVNINSSKNSGKAIVCTEKEAYETNHSLNYWENKLNIHNFFLRCHRNHIVNMNKIKEIEQWVDSKYLLKLAEKDKYKAEKDKFGAYVGRKYIKKFKTMLGM
jgi:DNA-binding LytR/AlgR family response regulator